MAEESWESVYGTLALQLPPMPARASSLGSDLALWLGSGLLAFMWVADANQGIAGLAAEHGGGAPVWGVPALGAACLVLGWRAARPTRGAARVLAVFGLALALFGAALAWLVPLVVPALAVSAAAPLAAPASPVTAAAVPLPAALAAHVALLWVLSMTLAFARLPGAARGRRRRAARLAAVAAGLLLVTQGWSACAGAAPTAPALIAAAWIWALGARWLYRYGFCIPRQLALRTGAWPTCAVDQERPAV